MQAKWGIACLAAILWLLALTCNPGLAAGNDAYRPLLFLNIASQTSMETQMLEENPHKAAVSHFPALEAVPSIQLHGEGDATIGLPRNLELNISIRYNREPSMSEPQRLTNSPLYMKYAVDYRVLSNLRVGLNSYLYRPSEESFSFKRPEANQLLGVGPEIKYDLGHWSFLLKSQVETGSPNQGKDLQNWFRVWYAF